MPEAQLFLTWGDITGAYPCLLRIEIWENGMNRHVFDSFDRTEHPLPLFSG